MFDTAQHAGTDAAIDIDDGRFCPLAPNQANPNA
jgi:hypothetical protein